MKVRKAVIPAAGVGTRFLPTSKSVPKELLPILDKPLIQYGVEELAAAGLDHIVIVTSPGKGALEAYFQKDQRLEEFLSSSGNHSLLEMVQGLSSLADFTFVEQQQPLGLGHAVLCAESQVGQEPFVVVLPDDVILPHPEEDNVTGRMVALFDTYSSSIVAVKEVPLEQVQRFGVVKTTPVEQRLYQVTALVEKPLPSQAPSNLAIVGRYVLTPEIFSCLKRTPRGAKGEIQLTDGMALLLEEQSMYAYRFWGTHLDGGTPVGLVNASLRMALHREDTRAAMMEELKGLLESSSRLS